MENKVDSLLEEMRTRYPEDMMDDLAKVVEGIRAEMKETAITWAKYEDRELARRYELYRFARLG